MTYALPGNSSRFKHLVQRPWAIAAISLGLLFSASPCLTSAVSASEVLQSNLADGVYAFSESQVAEQIGATNIVFEVTDGELVGGFYQPHSSFDCFYGEIAGNQMLLTVVDSYQKTEYPFTLAINNQEQIAAQDAALNGLAPSGFHRLPALNEMGQAVLQTCQTDL